MLKYLPIKMTAFNCQIKNASKPGALLSLAGKGWDDKGRPPLLSIDELLQTQTAQQASHANKGWEKSDTEAALIDAAKRKKTE
jgi:uracil DNA glycosylase